MLASSALTGIFPSIFDPQNLQNFELSSISFPQKLQIIQNILLALIIIHIKMHREGLLYLTNQLRVDLPNQSYEATIFDFLLSESK